MDLQVQKRIIELPKNVADKIAAGEVVDRPLSIVKELVENSIDAGATSIIVEIKNGGKTYIRVTDNGSGIDQEDVELAFKRHATSKIKSASDLDQIISLGFRGEALASISAVSRTELITKTAMDKSGIRIKIEGGEIIEKASIGCPEGTTVIIEDLFYNTPARLKFLKQDSTESTLIIDFISKMALAYSNIKFRLINNGNILFSTPGKGDIYTNILTVYSKDIGDKLIHLTEDHSYMSLNAFVSNPGQSKTNRKSQIFFVNGRYISSKVLENAITEAYTEKLFEGRYPIAFLFLNVSPDRLDVNIHPNKKEVRFDDDKAVKEFVANSIRKNLETKAGIIEIKQENIFRNKGNSQSVQSEQSLSENRIKENQLELKKIVISGQSSEITDITREKGLNDQECKELESVKENVENYNAKKDILIDEIEKPADMIFNINQITLTGSIFGTYITGIDENNFYLIDQHAAHERVFYEHLMNEYQREEKLQQTILAPFVINVSYAVKNESGNILNFIENLGFQIEDFGPKAYIVKAVPMFMELEEARDFLDYTLDNLSEDMDFNNKNKIQKIISNACKKSVKAHDLLDRREIEQLILDLSKTRNPYSCPHGRPTFIKLSKYEIEKMFKRV